MDIAPYKKPEYFRNRELSWVSFDERVLNEARDKSIPLFERLKFISITSSNLDEFYMVRVASLKDQVHANYTKKDLSGMDAKEQQTDTRAGAAAVQYVQSLGGSVSGARWPYDYQRAREADEGAGGVCGFLF